MKRPIYTRKQLKSKNQLSVVGAVILLLLVAYVLGIPTTPPCPASWCLFTHEKGNFQITYPEGWYPTLAPDTNDLYRIIFKKGLFEKTSITLYVRKMTQPTLDDVAFWGKEIALRDGADWMGDLEGFQNDYELYFVRDLIFNKRKNNDLQCQDVYYSRQETAIIARFCPGDIRINHEQIAQEAEQNGLKIYYYRAGLNQAQILSLIRSWRMVE